MHGLRPQPEPSSNLSVPAPGESLTAATAIALVTSWTDLSPDRRRRLISDVHTLARMAGLPASNVLLTPLWLRQYVLNGSAASHGVSEYRTRNLRSSLRFILRRAGMMDPAGALLSPAWSAALGLVAPHDQHALVSVARFCSSRGIPPQGMHEAANDFLVHLTERTLTARPRKLFGPIRIVWNRCCATIEGWPGQPLAPLHDTAKFILPLEAFPASFRESLAAFGDRLAGTSFDEPDDEPLPTPQKGFKNHRRGLRPLRASSVALRQSHARWAASGLVATGVPIETVTSLESLVTPTKRVRETLIFFYERAGRKGSAAGMHVAEVLLMIAKYHAHSPEEEITLIRRWSALVQLQYPGMTEKNETRIRTALLPHHEARLRELPTVFLEAARRLLPDAPLQARSLALRATAIGLLSGRPIRLADLLGLRLDRHLQRDDPKRGRITHISISPEETKNSRAIGLPLAPDTAHMLEEWITRFRPLVAGPDCPYLFPGGGTGNRPITPQGLRDAIKSATKQFVGVELTPHQFRPRRPRVPRGASRRVRDGATAARPCLRGDHHSPLQWHRGRGQRTTVRRSDPQSPTPARTKGPRQKAEPPGPKTAGKEALTMTVRNSGNRCWPVSEWPERDRTAWEHGCSPGDPFDDDPHYGAALRPDSREKTRKGYGRWLCFLAARGWLDPLQPPLQRVTRERLRAYFRTLRGAGNADYTVIGRFTELTMAMKILAPGQDVSWIRRPGGITIYAMLPKSKRALLVPDSGVLYAWALDMMDQAGPDPATPQQLSAWRDGLLLAMLASRGRRLRSMTLLAVGRELILRDRRYRIELTAGQVKTPKPDRFNLPEDLTPYVRHYLEVARPALLKGHAHDALWVNPRGGPWTAKGIQHRVMKLTRQRFGQGFGPHRFRHAIGTTAPMRDPSHPGVAAGLLGISSEVLELHYNRAGQSQAAAAFDQALTQRRKRLAQSVSPRRSPGARRS